MTPNHKTPALEQDIVTDFGSRMSYGAYLDLDTLLSAQHPVSRPERHDELLFIIQHQTTELWLKLVLHEIRAARAALDADDIGVALKGIARVKHIQQTLTEQWSVLATLTPTEYAQFRDFLGNSSGFQSHQYRAIEFILGNKNAAVLPVFESAPAAHEELATLLREPTLYDALWRHLARTGLDVPRSTLDRDVTEPHVLDPELLTLVQSIYEAPEQHWSTYEAFEELVDLEENFQLWRFRHLRTVLRVIGSSGGTGGSSGAGFLRRALDHTFFPELFAVRTWTGH
ncbi:tryptophan 2,3-dioxygenase family protein [Nocardia sp. NBC_00565]|uniref:tryptophan 2,3-dioxygenase n=1 Tax=Nocardia sp. NBC_00565 TaxID=2975993 RepID=UPI002E81AB26|nr:tryptophan 2,3-dioxygenase family protein [Nocardia sp. NBC_00565]WUC07616.1 tryptophan 2,3-dioxygenase family protein [Nocardia sp. NBC_00565]